MKNENRKFEKRGVGFVISSKKRKNELNGSTKNNLEEKVSPEEKKQDIEPMYEDVIAAAGRGLAEANANRYSQILDRKEDSGVIEAPQTKISKKYIENFPKVEDGGVSVVITAWKSQKYIEECLDSVFSQSYFKTHDNYEVLLGIDGCKQTLQKVQQIRYKYGNLRVFMMDKNVGTFITTNTLVSHAKYGWILRFDSDDIMKTNFVEKIIEKSGESDIVRCANENFGGNTLTGVCEGIILVKKTVLDFFGGYQPWVCAGDTEFLRRVRNYVRISANEEARFKRRIHNESLIHNKKTDFKSQIRAQYREYIKNETKKNTFIKYTTGECHEILKNGEKTNGESKVSKSEITIKTSAIGGKLVEIIQGFLENNDIENINVVVKDCPNGMLDNLCSSITDKRVKFEEK